MVRKTPVWHKSYFPHKKLPVMGASEQSIVWLMRLATAKSALQNLFFIQLSIPLSFLLESKFSKKIQNLQKKFKISRTLSSYLSITHSPSFLLESKPTVGQSPWKMAYAVWSTWKNKALSRLNQFECIRQSIKVQFDHRLRALWKRWVNGTIFHDFFGVFFQDSTLNVMCWHTQNTSARGQSNLHFIFSYFYFVFSYLLCHILIFWYFSYIWQMRVGNAKCAL